MLLSTKYLSLFLFVSILFFVQPTFANSFDDVNNTVEFTGESGNKSKDKETDKKKEEKELKANVNSETGISNRVKSVEIDSEIIDISIDNLLNEKIILKSSNEHKLNKN